MNPSPRRIPVPARIGLVAWPVVEIALLVWAWQVFGAWPVFLVVCAKAAAGMLVCRHVGRRAWHDWWAAVQQGKHPTRRAGDSAQMMVAGLLIMLPGLVGSALGLVLLIPATRGPVRALAARWAMSVAQVSWRSAHGFSDADVVPGDVIDGEVIDDPPTPQSSPDHDVPTSPPEIPPADPRT